MKKKIIPFMLIALFASIFAQAQRSQGPQQRPQQGPPPIPDSTQIVEIVNDLAEELTLSDEQKTTVSTLYFAHFNEAKKLMEQDKSDREKQREAIDTSREEFETNVKAVFSDAQKEKFEKLSKDKRPAKRGGQRPQKPRR